MTTNCFIVVKMKNICNVRNCEFSKTNNLFDIVKFFSVIIVVAYHTLWPYRFKNNLYFYYQEWFSRFFVPFFFISSGMFFHDMTNEKQKKYIKKILLLYIISVIIYLYKLVELYSYNIFEFIKQLFFGYYHLWYLSSLLFAICFSYFLNKLYNFSRYKKIYLLIICILLLFGIFFDEYYKLFKNDFLNWIAIRLDFVGTTRNGLFMAFPLFNIGRFITEYKKQIFSVKVRYYIILISLFFVLSYIESVYLCKNIGYFISNDLTVFNWIIALLLVIIIRCFKGNYLQNFSNLLRKSVPIVYVIHPLFMFWLEDIWDVYSWTTGWGSFFMVLFFSLLTAFIIVFVKQLFKVCRGNKY